MQDDNEERNIFCPDGVEFVKLGDIATITRGGNFQKKDFTEHGRPCIHYGQIHTHYGIYTHETLSQVPEEIYNKSRKAQPGDIVMATTSEDVKGVCKCVAWLGDEPAAVSGDAVIIHHKQNAKYMSYLFQSDLFYSQKIPVAYGVKVTRVSVDKLKEFIFPIPPIDVQEKIVYILDKFTELTRELTRELTLRKKQYEYYRDELLTFDDSVPRRTLGELGKFYGGLHGKNRWDFDEGNAEFITYMNVYTNIAINLGMNQLVKLSENEKQNAVQFGDVLFTGSSETLDECGMSSVMTTQPDKKIYLNSFCFGFRFNDPDILLPDFAKFLFRSTDLREQIIRTAQGVTRYNVSKKKMANVIIPIPPIEEQRRISSILDKFDTLCNDLTKGIPAEIEKRKKQYEYYRDKLLTFTQKS